MAADTCCLSNGLGSVVVQLPYDANRTAINEELDVGNYLIQRIITNNQQSYFGSDFLCPNKVNEQHTI